jgi:hypothetical protein
MGLHHLRLLDVHPRQVMQAAINGNPWQSIAINCNQLQSMALACSICMLSSGASPCVASARTPACQSSPVVAALSGNCWQS